MPEKTKITKPLEECSMYRSTMFNIEKINTNKHLQSKVKIHYPVTHFMLLAFLFPPVFLMFLEGIDRDQWHEMGSLPLILPH